MTVPGSRSPVPRRKQALRVALVGAGRMGSNHAKAVAATPGATLSLVVDVDRPRAEEVAARHGARAASETAAVAGAADAAIVAVPTASHLAVARELLRAGLPVLVEKPLAGTSAEAATLAAEAEAAGVLLQVGHVERWNPAWRAAREHIREPRFVEAHRLAPFSFRSADIGVVLDLMVHDLDLVLSITGEEPSTLDAVGVAIVTGSEDMANARLAFPGGCVANLTASRASERVLRRVRVFCPDRYVAVDLGERTATVWRRGRRLEAGEVRVAEVDPRTVKDPRETLVKDLLEVTPLAVPTGPAGDALSAEVGAFVEAVRTGGPSPVPGSEGVRTLRIAERVLAEIGAHARLTGGRPSVA
ncbi:MAG: Gfo/Idh/MocA family oxidoreductase [Planctomycetales bacterium]|nr:Gfo/Idh/MocA family oxidoreductase [Planctomycetales bacterium]